MTEHGEHCHNIKVIYIYTSVYVCVKKAVIKEQTWFKELADAATIMVPAHVQQSPEKSMAWPLPRTNPVPEVATTSMLD